MPWPLPDITTLPPAQRRLRRLPKVLLHEHLDGGLRPATLLALLHARGLPAPAPDAEALARWFHAQANAGSLEQYLKGFALTVAAMATPEALVRVAREAAQDALADGAVLAEFRIAPLLFEPYGIGFDDAVGALLHGLAQVAALPSGLIVCAMRHEPAAEVQRAARAALRWQGRGVVGFDLAGAEAGHPPDKHAAALAEVRAAGLPITLHAGEADAAPRVLQALAHGAARIGHGVRLADDPGLVREAVARGVHLELCPTSNVHTGAVASLAAHPIAALWRAGVPLSYHTDNRLVSMVSHSDEAAQLLALHGLAEADLIAMGRCAAKASFLPEPARAQALAALDAWPAK